MTFYCIEEGQNSNVILSTYLIQCNLQNKIKFDTISNVNAAATAT